MIAVGLIFVIAISSVLILPYMNFSKPAARLGDDKWSYLTHVFEEADAWNWINKNTPKDARIATYDIKEYYIERDVMPLDGNESAPLYGMDSIEEAIDFLHKERVTHVLSVPWASPLDTRMPNAYKLSVLTRYLGDPRYLPPVYVGINGTTVYHVGSMDENTVYDLFAQKEFAPPIKHVVINLTVTENTSRYIAKLYVPIPVDYGNGSMVFSVNGRQLVVELWAGLYPAEKIFPYPIVTARGDGNWSHIDRAGYFTFTFQPVDGGETFTENSNITFDLRFYNCWELMSP
jgi:hypothetical protein